MTKSNEVKLQFIQLRAEGNSYDKIAKKLDISKSTCSAWEKFFSAEIEERRAEELEELYNAYFMTKEGRIKQLGETLNNIEGALQEADLRELPAEKLLEYKLKYIDALKDEYTALNPSYSFQEGTDITQVLSALNDLYKRVRRGEVSKEQAQKESTVLSNILKAYDTVEIEHRLDLLENVMGD
ncbi:helix-turn-helix domain-containing protein [Aerococcus suis]